MKNNKLKEFSKKEDNEYEYYCEDRDGFLDINIDPMLSEDRWVRLHNKKQIEALIVFLTDLKENSSLKDK